MKTQVKRMKPLRFLQKYGRLIVGGAIIALILFGAIFAPLLTDCDPTAINVVQAKKLPSKEHPFGTDFYGRDIFARALYGARTTLIVVIGAQTACIIMGALLGLVCGYYKNAEKVLMRILDAFSTIPNLLLCLLMVTIFGAGVINLILAMSIGGIPGIARMVRNQVLSLREKEYIESEKAMGASDIRTLLLHILPSCSSYLLVSYSSGLAGSVLSMVSLSYLGLGLSPMIPSWGGMISEGQSSLFTAPHIVLFPSLMISLTVFGFSLLGDGVRDLLDPKLK